MKLGFVGWRSMVGSVLLKRMEEEKDFSEIETYFFSTSQKGKELPKKIKNIASNENKTFYDAHDLTQLSEMDIILTCQGSAWTKEKFTKLRKEQKWKGYWIDAASDLRMNEDSVIVLDPINKDLIEKSLRAGKKTFCGGNCTTAILLMGIGGLFRENLVESISLMSYQSASGAGAQNVAELMNQMHIITEKYNVLKKESYVNEKLDTSEMMLQLQLNEMLKNQQLPNFPTEHFSHPLAVNVLPWIDGDLENGQSKEEKKTMQETNKILGIDESEKEILIDGICVRVPVVACHSEALTITLKTEGKEIEIEKITEIIQSSNKYVKIIPNEKEATLKNLNPISVMGTLDVHVGRIRKMATNPRQICVFIVADQLMWGAAEPLRRILRIISDFEKKD